eukprot:scaffold1896_cov121-Isochrysis_galbana.AAC.17
MQALTANTEATATLVKLFPAESVEAGGSRQRWWAHPTPPGHMIMRNTSFGGRARCDWRSVPGNVGIGTSPGVQAPELCSRVGSARAWRCRGRHGFGSCWAQCCRPSQRRMARQEPLALLGLPLRGPSSAAPGIWRPQLELLRLPVRGAAADPSQYR